MSRLLLEGLGLVWGGPYRGKASVGSLASPRLTAEAQWSAQWACDPRDAALAEPSGCRSSSMTIVASNVKALAMSVKSLMLHVARDVARTTAQKELFACNRMIKQISLKMLILFACS